MSLLILGILLLVAVLLGAGLGGALGWTYALNLTAGRMEEMRTRVRSTGDQRDDALREAAQADVALKQIKSRTVQQAIDEGLVEVKAIETAKPERRHQCGCGHNKAYHRRPESYQTGPGRCSEQIGTSLNPRTCQCQQYVEVG